MAASGQHPPERLYDVTYYQTSGGPRSREARRGVSRRRPGAAHRRAPQRHLQLRAHHAAHRDRVGHHPPGSDRDRVDHLLRAYNLARLFSSLDHISGGRAGWNIVTTGPPDKAAGNFGLDVHPPDHATRYERAREFVDAVVKLWDSWEDDALVIDKERGIYADTRKIHPINFEGKHLKVAGPFGAARSPQGIRCSCRPGRPTTAVTSRAGTRRRSSPPTSGCPMRRRSTRTSRSGRQSSAATPPIT